MTTNAILTRYVSPFLAGYCMAGAAASPDPTLGLAFFVTGIGVVLAGLPAVDRWSARLSGSVD
jgi:hypothetical protein